MKTVDLTTQFGDVTLKDSANNEFLTYRGYTAKGESNDTVWSEGEECAKKLRSCVSASFYDAFVAEVLRHEAEMKN